jgi:hypothetical protein
MAYGLTFRLELEDVGRCALSKPDPGGWNQSLTTVSGAMITNGAMSTITPRTCPLRRPRLKLPSPRQAPVRARELDVGAVGGARTAVSSVLSQTPAFRRRGPYCIGA